MKYDELFESSILDEIFFNRSDLFETEIIKQKKKKNESAELYKQAQIDEELNELIRNLKIDDKSKGIILDKLNDYTNAYFKDIDYWLKKYYKLGFCDSKLLKLEIKEVEKEVDGKMMESFMNNYEENFLEYFEDYRFSKLQNLKEYRDILKQKRKIYEEYPAVRDFFEEEKIKEFSKEEASAMLDILSLDSMRDNLEIKESFKLGAKEFIVFAVEQNLIKNN